MKRFYTLVTIALSQYFVYRVNFVLWRVRNVLNTVLVFFLWSTLVPQETVFAGYTREEILTYILLMNIIGAIVLSTKTTELADDILSGRIIQYLLKPYSIWSYLSTREIADKLLNVGFAIAEVGLLFLLLRPPVFINTSGAEILVSIGALCIGIFLVAFISILLSLIAFWSNEIWGPRFLYYVLVLTFAGTTFPLDILPPQVYTILLATPLPYLLYAPVKIYIDGFTPYTGVYIAMGLFWCAILWFWVLSVWKKGMKEFSFYGK